MAWFDGVRATTLQGTPRVLQWLVLLAVTVAFVAILELANLPAAVLLGALFAAVVVSVWGGRVTIARAPLGASQGLIGCLIASAIHPAILPTMSHQWPLLLGIVCAVIFFSTVLGGLLAYWKVLPGTTAIWGSSPGGASVMVIMSESFGADIRLVAFMQFLRVGLVAALASVIARIWLPDAHRAAAVAIDWFPAIEALPLVETLAIAMGGAWIGARSRIPAGSMLVPMGLAMALSNLHLVSITLPPWLMAVCYALVGWMIGLRFTLDAVRHAARAFPKIAAATLALLALCGLLAWLLHVFSGIDPLTAYLATSPGGVDSVAIIAASSQVDLPFVMALQTVRLGIVMACGPWLAKAVSRWVERAAARPVERLN